jgi:hypothetical protein
MRKGMPHEKYSSAICAAAEKRLRQAVQLAYGRACPAQD